MATRGKPILRVLRTASIGVLAVAAVSALVARSPIAGTQADPRSRCQDNLRRLSVALSAYVTDWEDVLPNSSLYSRRREWDPGAFSAFASEPGTLPPGQGAAKETWPMVLYPYLSYAGADPGCFWCPADGSDSSKVSYYWKAAVDAAGFTKVARISEFAIPSRQMVLYERQGWHWGGRSRGLCDGVVINCAYLDGHVAAVQIQDSGYSPKERPAGPLPKSGVGEPAWFNFSFFSESPTHSVGRNMDPGVWGDRLVEVKWPVHVSAKQTKASCQENMKRLGTALAMYVNDWDGALPSSRLCGDSPTWNSADFARFAGVRGSIPPRGGSSSTWSMVLYPYTRQEGYLWCPSDPNRFDENPSCATSYFWKAAVDVAWYGGPDGAGRAFHKLEDFSYPEEQMVLYERAGWHGARQRGLTDGITINCLFLDGHAAEHVVRESGYSRQETPAGPLPRSGVGEPAWFNYSLGADRPRFDRGANWDPGVWTDNLP